MTHEGLMRRAIALAVDNVKHGGGPFGAVIARNGEIVAEGVNRVTSLCDPTAHAEVQAIRAAAAKLGTFSLEGLSLYTSCEPCPMCLGAIYWAHLSHLYYACTKVDAAQAGFDDDFIYKEFSLDAGRRSLPTEQLLHDEAQTTFKAWDEQEGRVDY